MDAAVRQRMYGPREHFKAWNGWEWMGWEGLLMLFYVEDPRTQYCTMQGGLDL